MNKAGSLSTLPLVAYYHRLNRYSFNALAGAFDSDPDLARVPFQLARTEEELAQAADTAILDHDRAVVALSVMTPQIGEVRKLIRRLRAAHATRIIAVAGGPHTTANPSAMLREGFDIAFVGEAEVSFPAVFKRIAYGEDFSHVEGIAFWADGQIVATPRAQPLDIDSFPSISPWRGMAGPIEITRGCPFACSFCQTSHIFGAQPRHRSVAAIVRQAASLRAEKRQVVRLLSPNAFSYGSPDGRRLNSVALYELLSSLRSTISPSGRIIFGYFPSETRPEHVTPETLDLLRRFADNDEIVIGAQSGSQRMLEACRRSHGVDTVLAAVLLARKFGYKVIVDFIFGLPGETAKDAKETVTVIKKLVRIGARIHPHAFVPLPQTDFSGMRPGAVHPAIIRTLEQLAQQHAQYGGWTEQYRLAHRVYRHFSRQASPL